MTGAGPGPGAGDPADRPGTGARASGTGRAEPGSGAAARAPGGDRAAAHRTAAGRRGPRGTGARRLATARPRRRRRHDAAPGDPVPGPGLRVAIGRAGTALGQWLRRPLTSLHLIIGVFGLLTLFGLVMVLSASAVESYTADGSSYSVFTRQLMFCVPGLLLFYLGLRMPPRTLRALAPAALVVGVLSLVAVLIVGDVRNGSRAWFALGSFSVQPSEAVKVALTLWGAHVLVARQAALHRWRYAISPVVPVTVLLMTLLVLQPDLGMTVSLGIVHDRAAVPRRRPAAAARPDRRGRRWPAPRCSR